MKLIDYILLVLVAAAVAFAVRLIRRNKGGCNGCCATCSQACGKRQKGERQC